MSNTRHAAPGSPLRQERFASSFGHGLLANLVAKRCVEIDPLADRAAIWFAQLESWKRGGLELVASEILRRHPLPEWRAEMGRPWGSIHPNLERTLASQLEDLCLNPRSPLSDVWTALDGYRSEWLSALAPIAETSVSQRVFGALDYTRDARTLTLIDGPARIVKSYSAQAWCDRTAGLARYVQIPCSNDDIGFFRAIGRALGLSASLQLKASEIRNRVEEVLQLGDLMLVLDESQYCWPQSWQRYAMPSRVNWILQALVNFNVPVALVTTPVFYSSQKRVEELTGWTSEQLIGRIGHIERLPNKLGRADLVKVAKALLPGTDGVTWGALAAYADMSKRHLASIEAIAKRAAWLASQDGNPTATAAYVRRAMKESVIPSDTALAESLAPARNGRRNAFARPPRMRGGYAAATSPSIPVVDDCMGRKTLQRGGLVTT